MATPEFVHLHAHTDNSLLDGCAKFSNDKGDPSPAMVQMAKAGFTHQAITDHGNIHGAIGFYQAAQAVKITPIIGCELYVATGSRFDKKASGKAGEENPQKSGINHLTVIARDNEGYQNLIELVTKASLEGFYYKPRVDKELLQQHSKGLLALSGCLKGEVAQAILADNMEEACKRAKTLEGIFGKENFYLEIMDHGMEAQKKVAGAVLEMSKKLEIPIVGTNDCHYFSKDDAEAHDALLCVGTGRKVGEGNRMKYASAEFYYKTPQEMEKIFHLYPEAMKNTVKIANKCNVKIALNELHLPDYQVPSGFTQATYLEHLCKEGLKKRFPSGATDVYQERLRYELSIIDRMGFPGYFLIVWDFIKFAKSNHIPVGPGRGSGAGCLVSYLLNITNVDPIQYGLLFERFLNPDRKSMPDLDIDFSDEGREAVIQYVREKYGFTNVAQIMTFGTMQSRLAIRDVGRVLDMPLPEVDKIASAIPHGTTIEKALTSSQEFKALYDSSDAVKRVVAIAMRLEGARRHTGVHAAGTVITKEPVTKYAPLQRNQTSGVVTTGFDDESILKLGLLKVDFLGLRTLTIIKNAVELIEKHRGIKIDLDTLPLDDAKTYEFLGKAQSGGVFQLESRGMRDLLLKLKPNKLAEIIALIALFRPGPMKWIDDYVARKHDPSKIRYDHPVLENILKESYGICLYQEQVMEIAKQLAGFTAGEADKLRGAISKKIPKLLEEMEAKFVEGAVKNKMDRKIAKKLYEDLKDFGMYAFNKSHSAAYGIVAYQTAYLKANYPLEFMTALNTSEIGRSTIGSDDKENKIATYLHEAKLMGFPVLPPSVNHSEARFAAQNGGIRFALLAVKNVGAAAAEAIVAEREKSGPFKDLSDFLKRCDNKGANKKTLESLCKSGAMDEILEGSDLAQKRGNLIANIDHYIGQWGQDNTGMLFEMDIQMAPPKPASTAAITQEEALRWEKEMLGVYLSEHPLNNWRGLLDSLPVTPLGQLSSRKDSYVWAAGILLSLRKQISKKTGQPWARATLEDLSGEVEVVIFPGTYAKTAPEALKPGSFVAVNGRVSKAFGSKEEEGDEAGSEELLAHELLPLDKFLAESIEAWEIRIPAHLNGQRKEIMEKLKEILGGAPRGSTKIFLQLDAMHTLELPQRVRCEKPLWTQLERLLGPAHMRLALVPRPAPQERSWSRR